MDKSTVPGAVLLPAGMVIKEGQSLWEGVRFGRFLGAGVQARVFELVYDDGVPTGKVIKVAHGDLGHKLLNNSVVWIGGEREWEIGIQMRAALQKPDGTMPGFMRVYDCVVSDTARGVAFTGMTMEKLQGWEVHKRLLEPDFHNIHYVREMLFQVFSALDEAERLLGFHHADLGMRNVMECYPEVFADVARKETQKSQKVLRSAEVEDDEAERSPFAEVAGQPPPSPRVPTPPNGLPDLEESAPKRERFAQVVPVRGYTCSARGEMLPLGPRVEFKIIDYGVAIFNEDLAESTGGQAYKAVQQRIREALVAKEVVFPSGDKPCSGKHVSLQLAAGGMASSRASHAWHLLPTRLKNKFRVRQTPLGAIPVPQAEDEAPGVHALERDSPPPRGCLPPRARTSRLPGSTKKLLKESGLALDGPILNPQASRQSIDEVSMSPVERMYRSFWRRKGDVFHILLSVGMALDNRVWPKHDEALVQAFVSLVYHVTGVKARASFAAAAEGGSNQLYGTLDRAQSLQELARQKLERKVGSVDGPQGGWAPFGLRRKWGRRWRRFFMIMQAHLHPYNSGLTAGEALMSPFFGTHHGVVEGSQPVDVEVVFPDAFSPPTPAGFEPVDIAPPPVLSG